MDLESNEIGLGKSAVKMKDATCACGVWRDNEMKRLDAGRARARKGNQVLITFVVFCQFHFNLLIDRYRFHDNSPTFLSSRSTIMWDTSCAEIRHWLGSDLFLFMTLSPA